MKHAWSVLVACSFMGLVAPPTRAETDAGARALAVQLFDDAEKLFASGQTSAACPKYAESYRLDPQLGVLIYLAECYEKDGRLASAWGSYREATEIAQKRSDARSAHTIERAKALEPRLSYVLLQVPAQVRVAGLELLRDGAPVAEVLWGGPAAIDPGRHRIEAHAPGYKPWQADITISKEGSTVTVNVPALTPDKRAQEPPGKKDEVVTPGTTQRIAALGVGGLGLVAIGVGGFFGLSAQSSFSDSKDLCNDANYCTKRGEDLRKSAKSRATVATVATGAGAAALLTAGLLWFTAPKGDKLGAAEQPRGRRLALAPKSDAWGVEVSGAF